MPIPRYGAYLPQVQMPQQISPISSILGELGEAQERKQTRLTAQETQKQKMALAQAQLEAQQAKTKQEEVLVPFRKRLIKAQAAKLEEPSTDIGRLMAEKNRAIKSGRKEDVDAVQQQIDMLHNKNPFQSAFGKLVNDKRMADQMGDTESAGAIQDQIDMLHQKEVEKQKSPVEIEKEKIALKDMSAYQKQTSEQVEQSNDIVRDIDIFLKHYNKLKIGQRGGTFGYLYAKQHNLLQYVNDWSIANKISSDLQRRMASNMKGARPTNAVLALMHSANLSPDMRKHDANILAQKLLAINKQNLNSDKFIEKARKNGITDPFVIRKAWNDYLQKDSVIDEDGNVNLKNIDKWNQYVPKSATTTQRFTDADIRHTAEKRGISEDEVRKIMRDRGLL